MIQLKSELDVFLATNTAENVPDFKVKGSWSERSCIIYLGLSNIIIAQVIKALILKKYYDHRIIFTIIKVMLING